MLTSSGGWFVLLFAARTIDFEGIYSEYTNYFSYFMFSWLIILYFIHYDVSGDVFWQNFSNRKGIVSHLRLPVTYFKFHKLNYHAIVHIWLKNCITAYPASDLSYGIPSHRQNDCHVEYVQVDLLTELILSIECIVELKIHRPVFIFGRDLNITVSRR